MENSNKYLCSLLLLFIIFFVCGCVYDRPSNDVLKFKNYSSGAVTILYANEPTGYLTDNNIDFYLDDYNLVQPNSTYSLLIRGNGDAWHNYINTGSEKKLFIFVFSPDTLKKYRRDSTMGEMVDAHKYNSLLQYTEQDLKSKNWTISYNPTIQP